MNGQQNMDWDWNNVQAVQPQQNNIPLNQNQLQQIVDMLQQNIPQAPIPPIQYQAPQGDNNIVDFIDDGIRTLQSIILMYGEEPQGPADGYDPRVGWYSRLDEMFDHMSRLVLGHRHVWPVHQDLRNILEPIFMAHDRMGRHIREEEARQILEVFINFRNGV